MSEEPGFEVASAYVSVSPDAASFPEQLEEQIGDLNFVVQIPVVPDAGDFAGQVEAEVGETDVAVQVPVVPDTEGFQLLIDDAVEEAKATVTVPVVPDAARVPRSGRRGGRPRATRPSRCRSSRTWQGSRRKRDSGAAAAGESAGLAFSERFAASVDGVLAGSRPVASETGPRSPPGLASVIEGAIPGAIPARSRAASARDGGSGHGGGHRVRGKLLGGREIVPGQLYRVVRRRERSRRRRARSPNRAPPSPPGTRRDRGHDPGALPGMIGGTIRGDRGGRGSRRRRVPVAVHRERSAS